MALDPDEVMAKREELRAVAARLRETRTHGTALLRQRNALFAELHDDVPDTELGKDAGITPSAVAIATDRYVQTDRNGRARTRKATA